MKLSEIFQVAGEYAAEVAFLIGRAELVDHLLRARLEDCCEWDSEKTTPDLERNGR